MIKTCLFFSKLEADATQLKLFFRNCPRLLFFTHCQLLTEWGIPVQVLLEVQLHARLLRWLAPWLTLMRMRIQVPPLPVHAHFSCPHPVLLPPSYSIRILEILISALLAGASSFNLHKAKVAFSNYHGNNCHVNIPFNNYKHHSTLESTF